MMKDYANKSGKSDVISYDIGDDYIEVIFNSGPYVYRYSYYSAHKENVEKMKELAEKGLGLNTFINSYCRHSYEKRVKII